MKPGVPWSVKGIEAEAREAAKFAARRSGMTLGEWLNSVILDQADDKDDLERRYAGRRRPPASGRYGAGEPDDLRSRLDALADQLASLNLRDQDTASGRYPSRSFQDPEADPALKSLMRRLENNELRFTDAITDVTERLDSIASRLEEPQGQADPRVDELVARVEAAEQHTATALDRMGSELGNLGTQMASLPAPASFERPEDVPGYSSLQSALRNVVDHIEVSDKRNRDVLRTMQDRIAATQKAAETVRPGSDNSAALDRLDRQLVALAERMESQEKRSFKAVTDMVEEKVSRLSEQVSTASHSTDSLVQKAETAAGRLAERHIRDAEKRLQSMIAEATAKAASDADGVGLARLRTDIETMGRRLEALKSETASGTEVRSLKAALEDVSKTVARGPDLTPFSEFEQRISELSEELNSRSRPDTADSHLVALAERIDELDNAVRAMAQPGSGDEAAIASLKQHIAAVDERLGATEQQLSHLQTIEKSIAQLFEALEHNKSSIEEIAEATARRVTDTMIARGDGLAASAPQSSDAIQALEQGLAAVKASAETADQRNHDTLEAVHETLEQIITKLGELEVWHTSTAANLARQQADQRAEAEPAAAAVYVADDSPVAFTAADVEADSEPATAWQSIMTGFDAGEGDDEAGQESPDEPAGTYAEGPATDEATAAEEDEESFELEADPALVTEEALDEDDMGGEDPQPVREDFIAAARRAAQSAAPRSAAAAFALFTRKKDEPVSPFRSYEPPRRSRLSLAFLKRKAKEEGVKSDHETAPADEPEAAAQPTASSVEDAARRKRLILVGAVLLAAAAAYSVHGRLQPPAPAVAPLKLGEVSPPLAPAVAEQQPQKTAETRADPLVEMAQATRIKSVLAKGTGMAPADALAQPTVADLVTTASLAPAAADNPDRRREEISKRLNVLVASADPAETRSVEMPSTLPEAIGSQALRTAARGGNANAQFVVASRYLEGKVVALDAAMAARWFELAAGRGLVNAQYRLATLFERGVGVPQDRIAARMWYQRAAEAGNVKAMHNLAVLLADNTEGTADYPRAARWFAAACEYGLKDSLFNLAVLSERGLGVSSDRRAALRLYLLAARQGDTDASARAETLRKYLASSEIASVEAEAAAWQPKSPERQANFVAIDDEDWNVDVGAQAKVLPPSPELTGTMLIARAQELLATLGFDIGTPDGVMGARTANAVRLFQMKNGLPVNGMVSNELLRYLMANTG